MPIGPIGQPPINTTPDSSDVKSDAASNPKTAFRAPAPADTPPPATPAGIASQLVQNARAQAAGGANPSIGAPLGDLVNAVTSQMGMPELPTESQQKLVAQLADDPVVKGLIG